MCDPSRLILHLVRRSRLFVAAALFTLVPLARAGTADDVALQVGDAANGNPADSNMCSGTGGGQGNAVLLDVFVCSETNPDTDKKPPKGKDLEPGKSAVDSAEKACAATMGGCLLQCNTNPPTACKVVTSNITFGKVTAVSGCTEVANTPECQKRGRNAKRWDCRVRVDWGFSCACACQ